jgi:hypothetical protein
MATVAAVGVEIYAVDSFDLWARWCRGEPFPDDFGSGEATRFRSLMERSLHPERYTWFRRIKKRDLLAGLASILGTTVVFNRSMPVLLPDGGPVNLWEWDCEVRATGLREYLRPTPAESWSQQELVRPTKEWPYLNWIYHPKSMPRTAWPVRVASVSLP